MTKGTTTMKRTIAILFLVLSNIILAADTKNTNIAPPREKTDTVPEKTPAPSGLFGYVLGASLKDEHTAGNLTGALPQRMTFSAKAKTPFMKFDRIQIEGTSKSKQICNIVGFCNYTTANDADNTVRVIYELLVKKYGKSDEKNAEKMTVGGIQKTYVKGDFYYTISSTLSFKLRDDGKSYQVSVGVRCFTLDKKQDTELLELAKKTVKTDGL